MVLSCHPEKSEVGRNSSPVHKFTDTECLVLRGIGMRLRLQSLQLWVSQFAVAYLISYFTAVILHDHLIPRHPRAFSLLSKSLAFSHGDDKGGFFPPAAATHPLLKKQTQFLGALGAFGIRDQ